MASEATEDHARCLQPQRAFEATPHKRDRESITAPGGASVELSAEKRERREPDDAGCESDAAPPGMQPPTHVAPITDDISEEASGPTSKTYSSEPTVEPTYVATGRPSRRKAPSPLEGRPVPRYSSTDASALFLTAPPMPTRSWSALPSSIHSVTATSRGLMLPPPVPPRKPPSRRSLPARPAASTYRRRTLNLPMTKWVASHSVD